MIQCSAVTWETSFRGKRCTSRGRCRPGPTPKGEGGGGGLHGPQNGCVGQWILWALDAQEILFWAYGRGSTFVFTTCGYTQNAENFVQNSKMGEKHKKIYDQRPDLQVGPWLMGAGADGQNFFSLMFKKISASWGSF